MSRGFPSMTALLGLLAVAGFQNRDKIAEMLRGQTGGTGPAGGAPTSVPSSGSASLPGGQSAGGQSGGGLAGGLGGLLGGSLGELVDSFRQNGKGDLADSWVGAGPNKEAAPQDLEQAIGPDVLDALTRQTGLSRDEILARLSRDLPTAVDHYTPGGRLPG